MFLVGAPVTAIFGGRCDARRSGTEELLAAITHSVVKYESGMQRGRDEGERERERGGGREKVG